MQPNSELEQQIRAIYLNELFDHTECSDECSKKDAELYTIGRMTEQMLALIQSEVTKGKIEALYEVGDAMAERDLRTGLDCSNFMTGWIKALERRE